MPIRRVLVGLLLLAGCALPGRHIAVVDEGVPARLQTTQYQGLFLTGARLSGRDVGPFILDTGAYGLVLDAGLARTLDLRFSGEHHDPEYGQTIRLATLGSLQAGPVTLHNTPVAVMDLSMMARALGQPLAGVLGYSFFAAAVVEFDYAQQSVSCFAPGTYTLPTEQWQPLAFRGQHPMVRVLFDGDAAGRFVLDTGSTSTVNLSPAFVRRHTLLQFRDIRPTRQIRLGGEREVSEGTIGWLELAGRRFYQQRVTFSRTGAGSRLDEDIDGIVGHGLMRHFVVVFNYSEGKVAFLPPRRPSRAPSA